MTSLEKLPNETQEGEAGLAGTNTSLRPKEAKQPAGKLAALEDKDKKRKKAYQTSTQSHSLEQVLMNSWKSVSERQRAALLRINEATGDKQAADKMIKALKEKDENKKRGIFNDIRNKLIGTVKRNQIRAEEIVPSLMRDQRGIDYNEALNALRAHKNILEMDKVNADDPVYKPLLDRLAVLEEQHAALGKLIRRPVYRDKKTGEQKTDILWAALTPEKNK